MPDPIFEDPRLVAVYDHFDGQCSDLCHDLPSLSASIVSSFPDGSGEVFSNMLIAGQQIRIFCQSGGNNDPIERIPCPVEFGGISDNFGKGGRRNRHAKLLDQIAHDFLGRKSKLADFFEKFELEKNHGRDNELAGIQFFFNRPKSFCFTDVKPDENVSVEVDQGFHSFDQSR